MNFAMDFMISRGYTPMIVPLLMRNEAMRVPAISPAPKNNLPDGTGRTQSRRAPPKSL
jgi:seryl-tRNA synthetase